MITLDHSYRQLGRAISLVLFQQWVLALSAFWFLFSPSRGSKLVAEMFDGVLTSLPEVYWITFGLFSVSVAHFVWKPFGSRLTLGALIAFLIFFRNTGYFFVESADFAFQLLLLMMLFMSNQTKAMTLVAVRLQWASIYFLTALWKVLYSDFLQGKILEWSLSSPSNARRGSEIWARFFAHGSTLLVGLSVALCAFELILPFALFSRSWRFSALVALTLFHATTVYFFGIWNFGVLMTVMSWGLFFDSGFDYGSMIRIRAFAGRLFQATRAAS